MLTAEKAFGCILQITNGKGPKRKSIRLPKLACGACLHTRARVLFYCRFTMDANETAYLRIHTFVPIENRTDSFNSTIACHSASAIIANGFAFDPKSHIIHRLIDQRHQGDIMFNKQYSWIFFRVGQSIWR